MQQIEIDDAIERLGHGRFQHRILLAAGLCFMADAMEILLMSFLTIVVQSQWQLSDEHTATLTSSVFIGAMLGTLILGPLGDHMGRKPVFSITAAIIAVFGLATALANSFWPLLICRFFVGFGVGGLTVPFDTLAEFIPTSHRGTHLLAIEYFWTAGTLLVPVLAYVSLGGNEDGYFLNDWRVFVVLCAVPCLVSTLLGLLVVPESPRWLLMKGNQERALKILRKAAAYNGKDPMEAFPEDTVLIDEEEKESSNFWDLLSPKWLNTTLILWGTWAGFAFTYFGTIIAVTLVFSSTADGGNPDDDEVAQDIYAFDYAAIFTSASSEIAGLTLAILLIDRIGRVPCQTGSYIGGGIMVFCLCLLAALEEQPRVTMMLTAFLARMFYMAGSCSTWVATAEILTTEIRTTGHSAANAVARLGGSVSPYLVSKSTPFPVIGVTMLAISLLTALCTYNQPETLGKRMGAATVDPKEQKTTVDDAVMEGSSYGMIT